MKQKIAISIDENLLEEIDALVDGTKLRSRSQAIEILVKERIQIKPITTAVILIHPNEIDCLFKKYENKLLVEHHLTFLKENKIKKVYIISKEDNRLKEIKENEIELKIIPEKKQEGTAAALTLLKDKLTSDFIVLNGDTLNAFDMKRMMLKHKGGKQVCTIGLMSSTHPSKFGSVVMDGELVVDFKEKGKAESNVVNAGIYIFKPNVFLLYDEKTKSLEKDLFPKLAKINLLQGFFTLGTYIHMPDSP